MLSLVVGLLNAGGFALGASQHPLQDPYPLAGPLVNEESPYYKFSSPIRRVAVIGAGPSGLQSAAVLREHGFEVRLFDRSPHPGGNWLYTPTKPLAAAFPDKPVHHASYVPDIPKILPHHHVYRDGEGGIKNEERFTEHWNPSPVWAHLTSNSAPVFTSIRDIQYAPDATWELAHRDIGRHVRQYASYKGINSNDDESRNITSYSTRVERLRKSSPITWTLTLRKFEFIPYSGGKLRADWWEEDFDAVVVSTGGYDAPHVPSIPHLDEWAKAFPNKIWHSRQYRYPEELKNKNVLIIGASISASEIARDIQSHVRSFSVIVRDHESASYARRRSLRRLPANITWLPEIRSFSKPTATSLSKGVSGATIEFLNGTTLSGFDEIIVATGFRRSNPFLIDYTNSTIVGTDQPDVEIPPILTDGTHLRSLHWTGHYIPDPTLAFSNVRAWTLGTIQATGFARIWQGRARIPNTEQLWKEYPGPKRSKFAGAFGSLGEESLERQYVSWLNSEAVEFGGRLVEPLPIRGREQFVYYAEAAWEQGFTRSENFTRWENTPRSEWKVSGAAGGVPVFWGDEEMLEEDW